MKNSLLHRFIKNTNYLVLLLILPLQAYSLGGHPPVTDNIELDNITLERIETGFHVQAIDKGFVTWKNKVFIRHLGNNTKQNLRAFQSGTEIYNAPVYVLLKGFTPKNDVVVANEFARNQLGEPILKIDSPLQAGVAFNFDVTLAWHEDIIPGWYTQRWGTFVSYKPIFYHSSNEKSDEDNDSDGVNDSIDQCPATPAGEAEDSNGYADSQKDTDNDGINDNIDQCPATPAGEEVDETGCSIEKPFIFSITTDGSYEIVASPANGFTPDYDVDCDSDGILEATNASGNYTCTYSSAGDYQISLFRDVVSFRVSSSNSSPSEDVLEFKSVDQWGEIQWQSFERMFASTKDLTFNATDTPKLDSVISMEFVFYSSAEFNDDISAWDTSNVTDMTSMFQRATSFNSDISAWNTSNVIRMSSMFDSASSFNSDISAWDFSSIISSGFQNFIASSGLSTNNYDALLNALSVTPNLVGNQIFNAAGLSYSAAGQAARDTLINSYGWIITGDTLAP